MLSWTALVAGTATGGSSVSIDNYEVQWDQGTATFVTLVTASATTYTKTGLTGGTTYQFMVRAINVYGNGAFSQILTVIAAEAPA